MLPATGEGPNRIRTSPIRSLPHLDRRRPYARQRPLLTSLAPCRWTGAHRAQRRADHNCASHMKKGAKHLPREKGLEPRHLSPCWALEFHRGGGSSSSGTTERGGVAAVAARVTGMWPLVTHSRAMPSVGIRICYF
jgi:hypothetical protein